MRTETETICEKFRPLVLEAIASQGAGLPVEKECGGLRWLKVRLEIVLAAHSAKI
jgi:hypothetical protein